MQATEEGPDNSGSRDSTLVAQAAAQFARTVHLWRRKRELLRICLVVNACTAFLRRLPPPSLLVDEQSVSPASSSAIGMVIFDHISCG